MSSIPRLHRQAKGEAQASENQGSSNEKLPPILSLMRPAQWTKNLFVFMPLFFGGELFSGQSLAWAAVAAVAFCLMASSIYCLNDIVDVEADRRHPLKSNRPIASGRISVARAYAIMGCLSIASLAITMILPPAQCARTATVLIFYFLLNVAYSLWLKRFAVVDVCIVALGFVLRVLAGSVSTLVEPSQWIVLVTFLLTLFLSLCKRRDDVLMMGRTGIAPRSNTARYNLTFIDQSITITATGCFVCYVMYTVSPDICEQFGTRRLYLTGIFVLVGLLRYIQLTVVEERSGDPTSALLHDRFCQGVVALWLLSFLIIIYGLA